MVRSMIVITITIIITIISLLLSLLLLSYDYCDDVLFAADLDCDPQELRRVGLDAHALEDL